MKELNYKKARKLIDKLVPYIKGIKGEIFDREFNMVINAIETIDRQFTIKIERSKKQ